MNSIGFIGTGSLAAYFVEGLCREGSAWKLMVSPRNAEKAKNLRRRFGVTIAGNQEIVDQADLVVVSLLPQQAAGVLRELRFRPRQTVLSVMSGVSVSMLGKLVAPADAAVSMMPGLANAYNVGPSVLHPDCKAARDMLEKLGPVHVYPSEAAFRVASVMGAFSGMATLMMWDAMKWFEARGLDKRDARLLVAEILKGNATSLLKAPLSMEELAQGFVTPGGITEQGRKILDRGGSLEQALDSVLDRVSTAG